jgi:hypothetical protein
MSDEDQYREYSDDREEDDYEEVAEVRAGERVGAREYLGQMMTTIMISTDRNANAKLERIQRISMFSNLSDFEKVAMIMGQFANTVFEKEIGKIGGKDKEIIERILKKIPHLKYKNPVGILLGFYVTDKRKRKIDESEMEKFLAICKEQELEITKFDIIRYSRLIMTYF